MMNGIKAMIVLAAIAGTMVVAALPASAQRTWVRSEPGWAFVPQGQYTGYPQWARSAFAPKD